MAAPLNTPNDFSQSRSKESDVKNSELLPPSCFQATSKDDPWKTLSETTKEVMQLRLENQKLREKKQVMAPAREEIHARVDVQQSHLPSMSRLSDLRAYEDIITRQASEIADQKAQLSKMEAELRREVAQLESQLLTTNTQNTQRVSSLHNQLRAAEVRHQEKICQIKSAHEEELKTERDSSSRLKQELIDANISCEHKVAALEEQLLKSRTKQEELESQYKMKISSSSEQIEHLESQLSQLKVYLGEAQHDNTAAQTWKQEKQQLQVQLQTSEEEKSGLESSIHLLNIRLTSVNEILAIHEKEISRDDCSDSKKKILLTRWREQVYKLLVQRKSEEIVHKKDRQNWMQKMTLLESELESMKNQINVLNHSLSDRTAELDMERNNLKVLQNDLTRTQQVALALDDQRQAENEALLNLQEHATSVIEKHSVTEEQMQKALCTLTAYTQRLSFAAGRLDMLQGQFARKEAHLRMQLSGTEITHDASENKTEDLPPENEIIVEQMRTELLRVTGERDKLANQVKEDASCLEEKVNEVKLQCADQIASLERRVHELMQLVDEKSEKCINLSEEKENLQKEADELSEEIEQLKLDIAKQKIASEKFLDERRAEDLTTFQEHMAEMERKINDARREQTKAVVALRQLERQSTRDKEKATKHLQNTEEFHKQEIVNLQHKLHSVETERNLFMSTLRQEGLIGKLRGERGCPAPLETEQSVTDEPTPTVQTEQEAPAQTSDKLTDVLSELQDLTAAVLEDDQNSSEEEIDQS